MRCSLLTTVISRSPDPVKPRPARRCRNINMGERDNVSSHFLPVHRDRRDPCLSLSPVPWPRGLGVVHLGHAGGMDSRYDGCPGLGPSEAETLTTKVDLVSV